MGLGLGEGERRGSSGEDRISGLPEELLHDILVRLGSANAAARTSVLSHRWRHVWAHLPELRLEQGRQATSSSFLGTVDGALAGYLAPTLEHLSISLEHDVSITAGRVAPWLQFAAEHMVGMIDPYVPSELPRLLEPKPEVIVLELPACQGAKRIVLYLTEAWRVWPQAAGLFTVLTSLMILGGCMMKGSELTSLVCTQCPCLRDLSLRIELIADSDVSVHSNSLHSLWFMVRNTRRLEVMAPKLEKLTVFDPPVEAHISATKLVMVAWNGVYDPHLHRFADVGRSLRLLETSKSSAVPFLSKQFDEVDELKLSIFIPWGVEEYGSFLNETKKLPKCKSLKVHLSKVNHALLPSVLQFLRNCSTTKKFSIYLHGSGNRASYYCPSSCPCCLEESHNIDGVALSSLEEVEINEFTDSLENMKHVEFLSSNAANLKRLVINHTRLLRAPPLTKEVCEKIRSMCRRNIKVKFHVFRDAKMVPFD